MKRRSRYRNLLILICFTFLLFYVIKPKIDDLRAQIYYAVINPKAGIQCYRNLSLGTLPDISEISQQPPKDRSIFFHETSCNSHFAGKIVITARQACAVESAAKMNPNRETYLLYASPGKFKFENTESDRFLQALLSYPNVHIHHVDYGKYTNGTPVEQVYSAGALENSGYAQSHASDLLRFLSLWKYGGTYLDLDVIVIQPLDKLGSNYAGLESKTMVAAGIINFDATGFGHKLATECLNDLKYNFKGHDWGNNGPGVITRISKKICNEYVPEKLPNSYCQGFKVHKPESFYVVPWQKWSWFLEEDQKEHVLNLSTNSYIIHVWNNYSEKLKINIKEGDKSAYSYFAQRYCPKVYQECDEFF